jgi:hypothetical protein
MQAGSASKMSRRTFGRIGEVQSRRIADLDVKAIEEAPVGGDDPTGAWGIDVSERGEEDAETCSDLSAPGRSSTNHEAVFRRSGLVNHSDWSPLG